MSDELLVALVVAVRLGVPILIPLFPLPAILVCLVVDAGDQTFLQHRTDLSLTGYQGYDKALDIYYLAIAYTSTIRNWTDGFAQKVAAFLWYYRLVGVAAFELTDQRWLLMVFPNTFEYVFIAYEALRVRRDPTRLTHRQVVGLTVFVWVVIKLPQEWWIHVAQLDFTDVMKEDVFGVPVSTSWAEAVGQNLWFLALVAVLVVALVGGWRALRRRLSEPAWPATLSVDRHLPPVGAARPTRVPLWSVRTGERVALVALICVIFASVLPNVDRGPVQTAVGVSVLVLANAVVCLVLVGRGWRWRSTLTQFLGMVTVNAAVLAVVGTVGRSDTESVDGWSLVFFGLLISLLVTLFDRSHDVRSARSAPDLGDQLLA